MWGEFPEDYLHAVLRDADAPEGDALTMARGSIAAIPGKALELAVGVQIQMRAGDHDSAFEMTQRKMPEAVSWRFDVAAGESRTTLTTWAEDEPDLWRITHIDGRRVDPVPYPAWLEITGGEHIVARPKGPRSRWTWRERSRFLIERTTDAHWAAVDRARQGHADWILAELDRRHPRQPLPPVAPRPQAPLVYAERASSDTQE